MTKPTREVAALSLLYASKDQLVKGQLEMLKAAIYTEDRTEIERAQLVALAAYEQFLDAQIDVTESIDLQEWAQSVEDFMEPEN